MENTEFFGATVRMENLAKQAAGMIVIIVVCGIALGLAARWLRLPKQIQQAAATIGVLGGFCVYYLKYIG
ncbi:hypothetical protein ACFFSY_29100 [Paenibacillus aurantiacus]|uniref:Uncharacterized protein n=1 Tax=Paenibacillus aurantiacus TaxID=1936118 RepID=A0ABV5KXU8_9BACL